MAADETNETIGSDWRARGVRMGLVSVMAATGMVLAGQAAHATPTVTEPPGTQADGGDESSPSNLLTGNDPTAGIGNLTPSVTLFDHLPSS